MTNDKRKKDAPMGTETSYNVNVNTSLANSTAKSVKSQQTRTRNWVFFVYPSKEQLSNFETDYDGADGYGSAPDNWRDILDEEHIQWVESPLHDKDKLPDGRTKKPHWHILLLFDINRTKTCISNLSTM